MVVLFLSSGWPQLSWEDLIVRLREIEKLLKRPMQRERFISQCIPMGNGAIEKLFAKWNISLKSLRWQQVVEFISHASCLKSVYLFHPIFVCVLLNHRIATHYIQLPLAGQL